MPMPQKTGRFLRKQGSPRVLNWTPALAARDDFYECTSEGRRLTNVEEQIEEDRVKEPVDARSKAITPPKPIRQMTKDELAEYMRRAFMVRLDPRKHRREEMIRQAQDLYAIGLTPPEELSTARHAKQPGGEQA